jgi:hypothetical protein
MLELRVSNILRRRFIISFPISYLKKHKWLINLTSESLSSPEVYFLPRRSKIVAVSVSNCYFERFLSWSLSFWFPIICSITVTTHDGLAGLAFFSRKRSTSFKNSAMLCLIELNEPRRLLISWRNFSFTSYTPSSALALNYLPLSAVDLWRFLRASKGLVAFEIEELWWPFSWGLLLLKGFLLSGFVPLAEPSDQPSLEF